MQRSIDCILHGTHSSVLSLRLCGNNQGVCVQGMSPEEINAYIERHGEPAAA